MPLKRPENPANDTISVKVSSKERNALLRLAAAEGVALSAFCRQVLADLINFSAAANHPALISPDKATPPYGFKDQPAAAAADLADCPAAADDKQRPTE